MAGGSGSHRDKRPSSVSVMPWQMQPGDATVVARVLREQLSNPPKIDRSGASGSAAQVGGQWDVDIEYALSSARHTLFLEQSGDELTGSDRGDRTSGDVRGWVEGDHIHASSRHRWEGASFGFTFDGKVRGDSIEGEVDLGEYFTAKFTAKRHQYGRTSRPQRPRKNI